MSSKSKTSSTTDQATHNVTTPTNPDWVNQGAQGLAGQIGNLSNIDPYSLVAGANDLQNKAANTVGALGGSPWNYNDAADRYRAVGNAGANTYAASTGTAASALPGVQSWMNPYTNDVVNTSLQGFDQNAGLTKAQNLLDQGQDTTFGGSGASITNALTNGQLALSRGQLEAGLRDQAFNTAASNSQQDAARQQEMSLANMSALNGAGQFNAGQQDTALNRNALAAQGLQDVSANADATQRANAGAQASMGDQLRQIQAAQLAAPLSMLQAQTGLFGQLPLGLFHGQMDDGTMHATQNSTTTSSNPMGALGTLAMGAGALGFAPFTGGASMAGLFGGGSLMGGAGAGLLGGMATAAGGTAASRAAQGIYY